MGGIGDVGGIVDTGHSKLISSLKVTRGFFDDDDDDDDDGGGDGGDDDDDDDGGGGDDDGVDVGEFGDAEVDGGNAMLCV